MPFVIHPCRLSAVQCLVIALALYPGSAPAYAGLCPPPEVQKESPYTYLLSLTDALSYAKSAIERYPNHKDQNVDSMAWMVDALFGMKLAKADFTCAASQVSPYGTSSDEAIKTSAEAAGVSFLLLADFQDKRAAQYKDFLDSAPKGNVKLGTFLDQQAELSASIDEAWKLLIPAATAATYSVVEEDPTTHLMSRLALTAEQRDKILHELRSTFGNEVTKGLKAGQISLVAAAAVLYEVIGTQKRKVREK